MKSQEVINIGIVKKPELEEIQLIVKSTFVEAFGFLNSISDMNKYLSFGKIESEFQNPGSQFYFPAPLLLFILEIKTSIEL